MNICVIASGYPSQSKPVLDIFIHEQAKEIVRQGLDVHVITPGTSEDLRDEVMDGVHVHRVMYPNFMSSHFSLFVFVVKVMREAVQLNKTENFDIIHSHFADSASFAGAITSKILGKPFVITAHGYAVCFPKKAPIFNMFVKSALNSAKKIICVSKYTANLVSKVVEASKIEVIHNGVDMEKLTPKMSRSKFKLNIGLKDKQIILSVANLVKRKGHNQIIRSLPWVLKSVPNLVYIIVGEGSEERALKTMVEDMDLKEKVIFAGFVPNEDIADYYNACDVFVLASRTDIEEAAVEGFGIVYIEASAMGKPVVGGRSGGTSEAVLDGTTGFLVNPNDTKELANKLFILLTDKELRKKIGGNGREIVMKNYLWKHNVKKVIKIYKGLIYNSM